LRVSLGMRVRPGVGFPLLGLRRATVALGSFAARSWVGTVETPLVASPTV
jgi:hypothetical protein